MTQSWTGASLASRFKHRFVYALIFIGGRFLAYLFLYPLVLAYTLSPSIRRKSRAYIQRRFSPRSAWQFFKHAYRLNLTFSRTLTDRAALGILGRVDIVSSQEDRALCQRLADEHKGIIMLSAHCGCWQQAAASIDFFNAPKYIVYYRNPKDNDKMVHEHRSTKAPFTFINPAGPLGGVVEMMAALRHGGVLCAMGDRTFGSAGNSLRARFLGGSVAFPYSFYRLAACTGAPVAVMFFPWLGKGRFGAEIAEVFTVPDLGPDKQKYAPYAQKFADALEAFCVKYPYQFFNYYNFWETN